MVCDLQDKVRIVWSFIKSHLKSKTIIFLRYTIAPYSTDTGSACKQVRFIHEAFSKLRPGVSLLGIHGKQKQMKRMAIFAQFCTAKQGRSSFLVLIIFFVVFICILRNPLGQWCILYTDLN